MTDPRTLAHTDARALAHEIVECEHARTLASTGWTNEPHSYLCDEITKALCTARKEAYERAAMVMDEFGDSRRRMSGTGPNDFYTGAAAIRKLGD